MRPPHLVAIITGPSAVGKTAVAKGVLKKLKKFRPSVTYTTRDKRKKYSEDKIMRYVTVRQFRKLIKDNKLLEWARVYGNFYGSSAAALKRKLKKYHVLINIDVQGAQIIKRKVKPVVSFFIKPDSINHLRQRLEARDMPKRDRKLRLRSAKLEIARAKIFDYQIINRQGKLAQTINQVIKILKKHAS